MCASSISLAKRLYSKFVWCSDAHYLNLMMFSVCLYIYLSVCIYICTVLIVCLWLCILLVFAPAQLSLSCIFGAHVVCIHLFTLFLLVIVLIE